MVRYLFGFIELYKSVINAIQKGRDRVVVKVQICLHRVIELDRSIRVFEKEMTSNG